MKNKNLEQLNNNMTHAKSQEISVQLLGGAIFNHKIFEVWRKTSLIRSG